EGTGSNEATLKALKRKFPALNFWIDAGFRDATQCREWLARGIGHLVLGSEGQSDAATLSLLVASASVDRIILSLDFGGGRFLGPSELLNPALWPARVIVMTLGRVGSDQGPDLARLAEILRGDHGRQLFAAGGVRDVEDLRTLAKLGVAGALIASALHAGRIGREEVVSLAANTARQ